MEEIQNWRQSSRSPSVPVLSPSSQVAPDFVHISRNPPVPSLFFHVCMNPLGDSSRVNRRVDPFGSATVPLELSPFPCSSMRRSVALLVSRKAEAETRPAPTAAQRRGEGRPRAGIQTRTHEETYKSSSFEMGAWSSCRSKDTASLLSTQASGRAIRFIHHREGLYPSAVPLLVPTMSSGLLAFSNGPSYPSSDGSYIVSSTAPGFEWSTGLPYITLPARHCSHLQCLPHSVSRYSTHQKVTARSSHAA